MLLDPWDGNWTWFWEDKCLYIFLVVQIPFFAGLHVRMSCWSVGMGYTVVIAWFAWALKVLERSSMFQERVPWFQRSETLAGKGLVVTGNKRWSCMDSQMGHHGADHMEVYISSLNLVDAVAAQFFFDLQYRWPKDGLGTIISCCPKRFVMIVFCFENCSKKRIFVSSNVPSCMHD